MENPGKSSTTLFNIPYSGRVIGAIVDALDIHDGVLTSRTAKRYFAGQSVNEYNFTEVFIALGTALVDLGLVPVPPLFRKHDVSMPIIMAETIQHAAAKWDGLCATLQSRANLAMDSKTATTAFLRLVVVDLALRVFALLRLAKITPPEPEIPLWAQENGPAKMLRGLLAQSNLTREQLAARAEVSPTSVDNWLDGTVRPTHDHTAAIARELASPLRDIGVEVLQARVLREFTFAELADILARHIGRDTVVQLAAALSRFIWLISEDVNKMDRPSIDEVAGEEMLVFRYGADSSSSHTLLHNLALVERDQEWRKDVMAATVDWSVRFQEVAAEFSWPRSAAGLAQDLQDLPSLHHVDQSGTDPVFSDEADQDLKNLRELGLCERDYGRLFQGGLKTVFELLGTGIAKRRHIVELHPLSPKAHFELGSFLGMAGKWLGDRDMIDQGVTECKIASVLHQDWDGPAVEPGVILGNAGYYQEALAELEAAAKRLARVTPHLAFNLGYVEMMLGEYQEALSSFELALTEKPQYALALRYAAHCAFMVGDKTMGIRYAKRARSLGEPGTYLAWRNGAYSRRKQRERHKRN